jgi:hypothetical protein
MRTKMKDFSKLISIWTTFIWTIFSIWLFAITQFPLNFGIIGLESLIGIILIWVTKQFKEIYTN